MVAFSNNKLTVENPIPLPAPVTKMLEMFFFIKNIIFTYN